MEDVDEVEQYQSTTTSSYSAVSSSFVPPTPSTMEEVDDTSIPELKSLPRPLSRVPRGPSFPRSFPPLSSYATPSLLSPPQEYKGVKIIVGDTIYEYDAVQDDNGMDCGVGIPASELKLSPTTRWATETCRYLTDAGVETAANVTIAVCKVITVEPPMEVYTVLNELRKNEPLLGRFILQDCVTRSYAGILSDPVEGAPVPGSWCNNSAVPSWPTIHERFVQSSIGKQLREKVEERARFATKRYKGGVYEVALACFQWVSVFGFFTHTPAEQYVILKNLACGWEKYLRENHEVLNPALLWALEAQKIQDNAAIQTIIERIRADIR